MKCKAKIITFLILTFCLFRGNANEITFTDIEKEFIKNNPRIEFGYEPHWPPYEMYEDGEYKGIIGDYVKLLEDKTGIDFVPVPNISWNETVEKLKKGDIKTSICVGITDERAQYLNFTKPYISSFMVIITRKDYGFIGGLEYLNKKTVAVPKNYYTGELLKQDYPKINIIYTESIYDAIREVSLGNADAFVGNLMVASYYIEHKGFSNLKVAAPTDYDKSHIALAAVKEWPELVSIADKVFTSLTFQEKNDILQKWINVRFEYGVNYRFIWKIGIYILVGVILVIGAVLLWNETLRKEIKQRNIVEKELANSLKEISLQNDERKNMLNEIHHRIKNNLHMVSGLLKLQGLESGSAEVEKHLNEAVERVRSIALVHDKIYKSEDTKNFSLKDFVEMLADEIIHSFTGDKKISISVKGNFILQNTNPLPSIALIMNELLTNSLKYAFINKKSGAIEIEINNENDVIVLMTYKDNGSWRKPLANNKTFGLNLIEIFAAQMGGEYQRETGEEGTKYNFKFDNFYGD